MKTLNSRCGKVSNLAMCGYIKNTNFKYTILIHLNNHALVVDGSKRNTIITRFISAASQYLISVVYLCVMYYH